MSHLPDIQSSIISATSRTGLDWVGIEKVRIPIMLPGANSGSWAEVSAGVNLTKLDERGIHMSRLFHIIQTHLVSVNFIDDLKILLAAHQAILASQQLLSDWAELKIQMMFPYLQKSLVSEKEAMTLVPLTLRVFGSQHQPIIELGLEIIYSSTCPQSYALSTQALTEDFESKFNEQSQISFSAIKQWLEQGLVATPHAQRSRARVQGQWLASELILKQNFSISELITHLYQSIKTVSQSYVKREDEKAFALLNAQQSLFCEDAARLLSKTLMAWDCLDFSGEVTHFESLHPFDVTAKFSKSEHS